jgi:pilus assembly protein CpaF
VGVTPTLEGEARELLRRSGLDPLRDEPAVRRPVEDAVSDYDERSMRGGLPVLADLGATSKAVWDSVIGYGALQQYFDDPTAGEV